MILTLSNSQMNDYDEEVLREQTDDVTLYNSVHAKEHISPLLGGVLILAGGILLGTYLSNRKEQKEAAALGEAEKTDDVKNLDFVSSGEKASVRTLSNTPESIGR